MLTRFARVHPRSILLAAGAFVVVGAALYFAAPWLLPVRILEGPLVQLAAEDSVVLVWYTTRPLAPGACQVVVNLGQEERRFPAEASGRRQRARIDGLTPGTEYPYAIRLGQRALTDPRRPLRLRANKPPGRPFAFLVFGDSGKGTREQYELAARMGSLPAGLAPADLLLHTGDLIYPSGQRWRYRNRFFAPYRHLLAKICFWPCLGNHDLNLPDGNGGEAYFEVFELPANGPVGLPPERNYWFDYADARFAVVDSNLDEAALEQRVAPWLREVLGRDAYRWKFVALHHPPYTFGKHQPSQTVRQALVPALEAAGVDVVFCGHDHNYQRTLPMRGGAPVDDGAGVVYVVSGAGGARLYDLQPQEQRPPYFVTGYSQRHSVTHVEVDGEVLTLRQIDLTGAIVDEWRATKTRSTPPSASAPASPPDSASLSPPPAP